MKISFPVRAAARFACALTVAVVLAAVGVGRHASSRVRKRLFLDLERARAPTVPQSAGVFALVGSVVCRRECQSSRSGQTGSLIQRV